MPDFLHDFYEKGYMFSFYFAAIVILILVFVFRDVLKKYPYLQLTLASTLFAAACYVIHFFPEIDRACFSSSVFFVLSVASGLFISVLRSLLGLEEKITQENPDRNGRKNNKYRIPQARVVEKKIHPRRVVKIRRRFRKLPRKS